MLQIFCSRDEYIGKFQVYGERHSGTKFLQSSISEYFKLPETSFYGHKHHMGLGLIKPEKIAYARHVLFIGIIRDPYDWLLALFDLPLDVPHHLRMKMKDFLTNEYYSIEFGTDNECFLDRNYSTKKNRRYKNILELRSIKLQYLNEIMPKLARNYILVSYEEFVRNHKNILEIISERFLLRKKGDAPQPRPIMQRTFQTPEYKSIIDSNLDWITEAKAGYYPR